MIKEGVNWKDIILTNSVVTQSHLISPTQLHLKPSTTKIRFNLFKAIEFNPVEVNPTKLDPVKFNPAETQPYFTQLYIIRPLTAEPPQFNSTPPDIIHRPFMLTIISSRMRPLLQVIRTTFGWNWISVWYCTFKYFLFFMYFM